MASTLRAGGQTETKWDDDLVFTVAGTVFRMTCPREPRKGAIGFKVEDERLRESPGRPGFLPIPGSADRLRKAAGGLIVRCDPSRTGACRAARETAP